MYGKLDKNKQIITCTCINILKGVPILVKFQGNFQNYAYTVHVDVDLRKKYFLLYKVIKLINIFIEFCL